MKRISTIINHRKIISHYAELLSNHVTNLLALEQTALRFDLKRLTVKSIVENNEKYFKSKKKEFNKCPIKLRNYDIQRSFPEF